MNLVETQNGKIDGMKEAGYTVYKGIPYAKAPVGELRWKAPQKAEKWTGILKADHFGAISMQESHEDVFYGKEFYNHAEEYKPIASEDSLYLNIWTPAKEAGEKLPVAFWIHGGAFMGGCGSEKEFDGAALCKRGVILVTINYRLNIFGFLAHPWLNAESEQRCSGNYGILDQLMALQWVYDNIESFGGDRENITVFGQSAGAMSVQTLVSSELSGNMIKRAIFQSGGSYGQGLHRDMTLKEAMSYGERFVSFTGAKSLEELRNLSVDEINKAMGQLFGELMAAGEGLFLIPNIDGYVLKDGYYKLIDEDKIKNIPYLLGSNLNDILVTKEDVAEGKMSILYAGCRDFSLKLEENHHAPAYVYHFTRQLPGDGAGAFHSAELWYMFGTQERCWRPFTEHDKELSEEMLDYWTNFMKTGNPNGENLAEWRACGAADQFVMQFE